MAGSWDFYADPRTDSVDVFAIVTLIDGTVQRYDFPDTSDNFLETHWTERWAEYEETLAYAPTLWEPTARRISFELGGTSAVAVVELVALRAPPPAEGQRFAWGPQEVLFRFDSSTP